LAQIRLAKNPTNRAEPICTRRSSRMHLVLGRAEVVVEVAFFFKCCLRAREVVEFELRVRGRNMLLKS
jgi:hypothetical protein